MSTNITPERQILASIVIPCFRRPAMVSVAVRSALAQDFTPGQWEVIVVDSSPEDDVETAVTEMMADADCPLRYFRKKPEGPGPSRNLGAEHSRGRFLAFLDSDCEADSGWLRAAVAAFEPGVGIVQGRTLPMLNRTQGIFFHTLRIESESFLYETANIVYRREAFFAAGGFQVLDANPLAETPLGGEDVDLAWRVKRLDWQSRFCGEALVRHEVLPMNPAAWIWISRQQVFPFLVRRIPELRDFFFLRYFFDRAQAYLLLLLAGLLLASYGVLYGYIPAFAGILLSIPYIWHRSAEPSRSLRGPLRLIRPMFYILRDLSSLLILTVNSVKARCLLL